MLVQGTFPTRPSCSGLPPTTGPSLPKAKANQRVLGLWWRSLDSILTLPSGTKPSWGSFPYRGFRSGRRYVDGRWKRNCSWFNYGHCLVDVQCFHRMGPIVKLPFQFTHCVKENLSLMSGSEICGGYSGNEQRDLGLQIFHVLTAKRNQRSMEMWTKLPTRCVFHCCPLSIPLH